MHTDYATNASLVVDYSHLLSQDSFMQTITAIMTLRMVVIMKSL